MRLTTLPKIVLVTLLTLIALCEAVGQSGPATPTSGSSIRGRVVYADTGNPLRRAKVHIVYPQQPESRFDNLTGRKGEFVIPNLPTGRYFLVVEAPGVLSPDLNYRRDTSILDDIYFSDSRNLFHEVYVNGKDNAYVEIKARRGGVITGRVTSEDDQPLTSALIKLYLKKSGKLFPISSTWNRYSDSPTGTDSNGNYRIAGLAAGEYIVRVSEHDSPTGNGDVADSYGNGSFMVFYYPGASTIKNAQTVSIVEGSEATGIDIRMPERSAHTVSGLVTLGPDRQPAAYLEVRLDRVEEQRAPTYSMSDASTRTDESGRWEVRGIPDGDYLVVIGGSARTTAGYHRYVPTLTFPVKVNGGDVLNINSQLGTGGYMSGTLTFERGKKREGDFIFIRLIDDSVLTKTSETAAQIVWNDYSNSEYVREEQDRFESTALRSGKYWLKVSGLDPDRLYVKSITRNGMDISQSPINITDGLDYTGVKVVIGSDVAVLEGKVVTSNPNRPPSFKDVVIVLVPANPSTTPNDSIRTFLPDKDGRFLIRSAPGEYRLVAMTRNEAGQLSGQLSKEYFSENKSLGQQIKLKASETLKGVVLTIKD